MEDNNDYIILATLKKRGWTDSMIKKLALTPDKLVRNPRYKKAASMKIFSLQKVERLERTELFNMLLAKSRKRKKSAAKAVETKRTNLFSYVESVPIIIKYIPEPQVTTDAIESYNYWQSRRPSIVKGKNSFVPANMESDDFFINRIRSNYIRHKLTNYDEILKVIKGHVGVGEGYFTLKRKVMDRIDTEWSKMNNK